jgi:hypothetical protein
METSGRKDKANCPGEIKSPKLIEKPNQITKNAENEAILHIIKNNYSYLPSYELFQVKKFKSSCKIIVEIAAPPSHKVKDGSQ